MKQFNFRFEKIRTIKAQELDGLLQELSQLRNLRMQLQEQLLAQNKAWLCFDQEVRSDLTLGISGAQFQGFVYRKNAMLDAIKDLEQQVLKTDLQIDVKLQQVLAKKGEVKGYEKLKEKQRENYNEALRKWEQQQLDERITLQVNQNS
ncbi:MAG: flagellar export protein FliJ [Erysipelotrichaceae bacterium]